MADRRACDTSVTMVSSLRSLSASSCGERAACGSGLLARDEKSTAWRKIVPETSSIIVPDGGAVSATPAA